MQLFCLTIAGGTAAFYNQFEDNMNSDISIEKLEYAGHGARYKEPFYEDFSDLAIDMYETIKERISGEYALFGYSMGSISATEIIRVIKQKAEIQMPKHVFLAAHEPFSRTEVLLNENDADDYVRSRTIQFGGIPEELLHNKSFWRIYLPIYKNDYEMIEKYHFDDLELKVETPLTIFYSEEDTPLVDMKKWQKYYIGETRFARYEGAHFFINSHCKEICNEIERDLGY